MADTEKPVKNRKNLYLAIALGAAVLLLYLFAFTVDWPSLWRSTETN